MKKSTLTGNQELAVAALGRLPEGHVGSAELCLPSGSGKYRSGVVYAEGWRRGICCVRIGRDGMPAVFGSDNL